MDYTPDEASDGARDMIALIRARHNDDAQGIAAILDGAGERGLRAITETYIGAYGELLLRLQAAAAAIEDEETSGFILTADTGQLLDRYPGLHAALEQNIASVQAETVAEE